MEKEIVDFRSTWVCPFDSDKYKDTDFYQLKFRPVAIENEIEDHNVINS